jgi:hypothetical protein
VRLNPSTRSGQIVCWFASFVVLMRSGLDPSLLGVCTAFEIEAPQYRLPSCFFYHPQLHLKMLVFDSFDSDWLLLNLSDYLLAYLSLLAGLNQEQCL